MLLAENIKRRNIMKERSVFFHFTLERDTHTKSLHILYDWLFLFYLKSAKECFNFQVEEKKGEKSCFERKECDPKYSRYFENHGHFLLTRIWMNDVESYPLSQCFLFMFFHCSFIFGSSSSILNSVTQGMNFHWRDTQQECLCKVRMTCSKNRTKSS